MDRFEELIVDLYDKQMSGEYDIKGEKIFLESIAKQTNTFSFIQINNHPKGRRFLTDNLEFITDLYLESNTSNFNQKIPREMFKNFEYKGNTLVIDTVLGEQYIPLKANNK